MNTRFSLAALAALVTVLVGCVIPPPTQRPTPIVKNSVLKPSLTPLTETKASQEKGGVEISVVPVTYTVVDGTKVTNRTLYERKKRDYTLDGRIYETPVRIIERTTTSVPEIEPKLLKFQVRVINKMPRVFRGQGMVVQYNVDGKLHDVDPSRYANLTGMILPERNEKAVDIYGPPLNELPGSCPVAIFLYDVVTQTDSGGNVTEKQNFTWYYNYATQLEQREGTTSTERLEETLGPQVRVK